MRPCSSSWRKGLKLVRPSTGTCDRASQRGVCAHLAAVGVLQAAVLAEAVTDAREEVSDEGVVAGEGARHNVAVHDDVADGPRGQAHALQQRPAGRLARVQQGPLLHRGVRRVQACAIVTLQRTTTGTSQ